MKQTTPQFIVLSANKFIHYKNKILFHPDNLCHLRSIFT